jgi:predicted acylesterase/phospholipase RssA
VLRNAGITFDAIAGSSVGALNAALWSADRLDAGETFWRSLSLRNICRPRRQFLMYFLLPFHLLSLATDSDLRFQSAKNAVSMLRHRLYWFLVPLFGKVFPLVIVLLIAALFFTPFGEILKSAHDAFSKLWNFLWTAETPVHIPAWQRLGFYLLFASLILFNVGYLFLTVVPTLASLLWRRFRLTLFDTAPLRNAIAHALTKSDLAVPTYVTLAKGELLFDPDEPFMIFSQSALGDPGDPGFWVPSESEIHSPLYERVDQVLQSDRLADLLVASTALPLGLFPSVTLGGQEFVDGGVADNLPVWPLLEIEGCNELWVVRLRPEHENDVVDHWQRVDRQLRLREIAVDEARQMSEAILGKPPYSSLATRSINPPVNVPHRQFPSGVRIVTIAPRKSIGHFFGGMMNFNARYARRLLALGQADAEQVLRTLGLSSTGC